MSSRLFIDSFLLRVFAFLPITHSSIPNTQCPIPNAQYPAHMNNHHRLLLIKWVHTVIWAIFVALIFFVVYSGISGRITWLTWISIALVVGEGLVLLLFGMSCPLTVLARRYSDSERDNFDIYLPNWLARYNKVIFTSIFLIGVLLVIYRVF